MKANKKIPYDLLYTAVRKGIYTVPGLIHETGTHISTEETKALERILARISPVEGTTELKIPPMNRWANRFSLGADPEFVFNQGPVVLGEGFIDDGRRLNPTNFGFRPGFAWGADQNGRLVEVRPAPHRSALHVTASILDTFRWMVMQNPELMEVHWIAWPIIGRDGVGGHIHLSRMRGNRKEEVTSLDSLVSLLAGAGMFDKRALRWREQAGYGTPGDIRPQTYGYEYRTMPPWTSSPELAFFVLTLSKLVALCPEILPSNKEIGRMMKGADEERGLIERILYFFKGIDDDARLALLLYQRKNMKLPTRSEVDMKTTWGISYPYGHTVPVKGLIPPFMLKPTEKSIEELVQLFLEEKPLKPRMLSCNWSPNTLPRGYRLLSDINYARQLGMGELVAPLVASTKLSISFEARHDEVIPTFIQLPRELMHLKPVLEEEYLQIFAEGVATKELLPLDVREGDSPNKLFIRLPRRGRIDRYIPKMRKFLTTNVLPIWMLEKVEAASYETWVSTVAALLPKELESPTSLEETLRELSIEVTGGH